MKHEVEEHLSAKCVYSTWVLLFLSKCMIFHNDIHITCTQSRTSTWTTAILQDYITYRVNWSPNIIEEDYIEFNLEKNSEFNFVMTYLKSCLVNIMQLYSRISILFLYVLF